MTSKLTTVSDILAERICKRLADLAHNMAMDNGTVSSRPELSDEMRALKPQSFQVIYDVAHSSKRSVMPLIEKAVNDNTNQQIKDTQGEFSYGDGFLDMFDDGVAVLITFDPKNCMDAKERYAALMVVERFEFIVERMSTLKAGRKPAGTGVTHYYGVIRTTDFPSFADYINGALGKFALPEDLLGDLDFDRALKKANRFKGQPPKCPRPPKPPKPPQP